MFVKKNHFFPDNKSTTLLGLELTWFVLISVSCFLAVGAVLAGLLICICRHNPNSSDNQIQCKSSKDLTSLIHSIIEFILESSFCHYHVYNLVCFVSAIDMNGSTKYMHKFSGNLLHPANKLGYTQILSMVTEHQRIWRLTIY